MAREHQALLLIVTGYNPEPFRIALKQKYPELVVYIEGESFDPTCISYALCWKPGAGRLANLPELKIIFSMAAGIDHILADPDLPRSPPIVRLIHDATREQMRDYVQHVVLHYYRRMDVAARQQVAKHWQFLQIRPKADFKIGILGLGEMGRVAAVGLRTLGFSVMGWARTQKDIKGVESFTGRSGLQKMLGQTNILISLLPATPETIGILNDKLFLALPQDAVVVNLGRGNHLVADHLLASLESGHLAGATLDVYSPEPMPIDDPFWTHPLVRITPHVASEADAEIIAKAVVENIRRVERGNPPGPLGERLRGY